MTTILKSEVQRKCDEATNDIMEKNIKLHSAIRELKKTIEDQKVDKIYNNIFYYKK